MFFQTLQKVEEARDYCNGKGYFLTGHSEKL